MNLKTEAGIEPGTLSFLDFSYIHYPKEAYVFMYVFMEFTNYSMYMFWADIGEL